MLDFKVYTPHFPSPGPHLPDAGRMRAPLWKEEGYHGRVSNKEFPPPPKEIGGSQLCLTRGVENPKCNPLGESQKISLRVKPYNSRRRRLGVPHKNAWPPRKQNIGWESPSFCSSRGLFISIFYLGAYGGIPEWLRWRLCAFLQYCACTINGPSAESEFEKFKFRFEYHDSILEFELFEFLQMDFVFLSQIWIPVPVIVN